jgi:hypothetical protein
MAIERRDLQRYLEEESDIHLIINAYPLRPQSAATFDNVQYGLMGRQLRLEAGIDLLLVTLAQFVRFHINGVRLDRAKHACFADEGFSPSEA